MTERAKPYVGVSGVDAPEVQQQLIELFDDSGLRAKRELMLGVKALHKGQWLDLPGRRGPGWDVTGEAFRGCVDRNTQSVNVAQAYFDIDLVNEASYRDAFLQRIFDRGSAWIDGIQFDSYPWHKDEVLMRFLEQTKEQYPDALIYLQCHQWSMDTYAPKQMAQRLGEYAHAIDYLLFDASHGKGITLDTERLVPFIDEIYASDTLGQVGVALAGGLCAETIGKYLPAVVERYPDISWDAEGRLHPKREDGTMPLDLDTVTRYFAASAELIS